MVLLDLFQLPSSGNAGGLIAHMGGAAFGYFYASQLKKGNDIGIWFENLMDSILNLFKSKKHMKNLVLINFNRTNCELIEMSVLKGFVVDDLSLYHNVNNET